MEPKRSGDRNLVCSTRLGEPSAVLTEWEWASEGQLAKPEAAKE